jgi:hypothetical protein
VLPDRFAPTPSAKRLEAWQRRLQDAEKLCEGASWTFLNG